MDDVRRVPVKAYEERLYCYCGGEMKATGTVFTVNPPLYQHECTKCVNIVSHEESYPRIVHEPEDSDA